LPTGEGAANYIKPNPPAGGSQSQLASSGYRRPRGKLIEHRIAIAAPAEVVWELISDFPSWRQWNPLYSWSEGSLDLGQLIHMKLTVPGSRPISFSAKVTELVDKQRVQYQAQVLGGLLRGTRYITIERSGPEKCIVVNGEIMEGLLAPIVAWCAVERVRLGLQLMSEGLQKVSEARWQGLAPHGQGATGMSEDSPPQR
jgi:hypothetical protein